MRWWHLAMWGGACAVAASVSLDAQWLRRQVDAPRTAAGEVDLDAATPRTADDRPDLSGVWRPGGRSFARGRSTGFSSPGPDVAEATGAWIVPYAGMPERTSYGEALLKARLASDGRDNPRGLCLPIGIVQLHTHGSPVRYVHTAQALHLLYEWNSERRDIFTDGRAMPENDPQPWWNGYSVGRWEGDVLVVETAHFRDGGWLDFNGNPLTDAARITERFRRPSYGRMEIDVTIADPKAYVRPFTVRVNLRLAPGEELIESVCNENNRFPPPPERGAATRPE